MRNKTDNSSLAIYFDPSYKPSFFYSLLKPLCALYDRVVIWQPVLSHLEEHGFSARDFLEACRPSSAGPAVIAPAGRDTWFDPTARKGHPDSEVRSYDSTFEGTVKDAASAGERILGRDYQAGYDLLERLLSSSAAECERITRIANAVLAELPSPMRDRLAAVASEQKKTVAWATANSFVQDVVLMGRLRTPGGFVSPELAKGYLVISRRIDSATSASAVCDLDERMNQNRILPGLPAGIASEELVAFFEDVHHLRSRSWSDVLDFRRRHKEGIRRWLHHALDPRRRVSGQSLSDLARHHAEKLYSDANKLTRKLGLAVVGGCGIVAPGLLPCVGVGLALARYFIPVERWVARSLNTHGKFLVDTPFFANAELGQG